MAEMICLLCNYFPSVETNGFIPHRKTNTDRAGAMNAVEQTNMYCPKIEIEMGNVELIG